jgi:hypothetical protein
MRDDLQSASYNIAIHGYYKEKVRILSNHNQERIEASSLYKTLFGMPKGGVHHLHITAAASVDFLIKLTYEDVVYYS